MALITMLLRARARHRWRSWLMLCLLVSVVSGLVLAAADAGRRTSQALPEYDAAHGFDAFFYALGPLPRATSLPQVASAVQVISPANGQPVCACTHPVNLNNFAVMGVSPAGLARLVKLVSGRMPRPSDPYEVLASVTMQQQYGVHVGSVLDIPFAAASQRQAVLNDASLVPRGPHVRVRVVGISMSEIELPANGNVDYDVYTTPAFSREFDSKTVLLYMYFLRLHQGEAGFPGFEAAASNDGVLSVTDLNAVAARAQKAVHPQVVGWSALSALAALVGIIVVAQALGRQAGAESGANDVLRAVGLTKRQLVTLTMAGTLAIAVIGSVGGVVLAWLLSPFTPVGEARLADPHSGFAFDAPVLLLGLLAAIVAFSALGLWPAVRSARPEPSGREAVTRPSRAVSFLGRAGAPPSAIIGARRALERGPERAAVPVGSALVGSVLAVAALCGTVVFGASLSHLTSTPALYGQWFNAWFSTDATGTMASNVALLDTLERDPAVTAVTGGINGDVSINGHILDALAGLPLKGSMYATNVSGGQPTRDDQIVVGTVTLRQLGAHIGSWVDVSVPLGNKVVSSRFQVVGTAVFPSDFSADTLGTGAGFPLDALLGGKCGRAPSRQECELGALVAKNGSFVVQMVPGPRGQAAIDQLAREYPTDVEFPTPPTNVVNFGDAVDFPLLFGVLLVVFATTTLLHVLVVSVARRRREVGLLKALGFVRAQVAWSVSWQTTTVALVGIVVGVPGGIALGRIVWQAFASNLGVRPVPVVTAWAVAAVALGTLVVANVLAVGPALAASRSRPASLLQPDE